VIDHESTLDLVGRPEVKGVSLTGSLEAGRVIAEAAGRSLKKSVMELGGSDPYLVFPDADIERAAELCVQSRMINSGQSCIAAKRFIVVGDAYEPFIQAFRECMKGYAMEDPRSDDSRLGPLARHDLRQEVHHQVSQSVSQGAKLLLGGEIPNREGFYYPATILTNVEPGMAAFDQEVFGPVAAIIHAPHESKAIELANQTPFGLGAAIFSRDEKLAEHIARERLEVGICAVNEIVVSEPRISFGGVKASGYGRELGEHGLKEFTNIKTIRVAA
jgi:succinate-semialdehyde dehydrogenase / glutarate-semialdehyde dehydrogenase